VGWIEIDEYIRFICTRDDRLEFGRIWVIFSFLLRAYFLSDFLKLVYIYIPAEMGYIFGLDNFMFLFLHLYS
jgi:hypothetical protein